jgi:hypothetical protein
MVRSSRLALIFGIAIVPVLLGACLSPNPQAGTPAATPATAVPIASPTAAVSQPQPGANGTVISGTITFGGAPPPPDSTLFLGLASSPGDPQPATCIDAERDPVDSAGRFRAQVACSPKPGQLLAYTLVIGPPGQRNWHTGTMAVPSDLTNLTIDAQ